MRKRNRKRTKPRSKQIKSFYELESKLYPDQHIAKVRARKNGVDYVEATVEEVK